MNKTTQNVYSYLELHPGATLEDIRAALNISSRSNVMYHMRQLEKIGLVEHVAGQHRSYKVITTGELISLIDRKIEEAKKI